MAIQLPDSGVEKTLDKLVAIHAPGEDSKTIIFCETKREVDNLVRKINFKSKSAALHGDIS